MKFGRSALEEAEYRRAFYPGTDALRNRLGIQDAGLLEVAERQLVSERLEQGLPPEARVLSYGGFKAIHRHLFQDIYDWAGQERRYTTGRGAAPFAVPEFIGPWMDERFSVLRDQKFLIGMAASDFAARAAEHVNEINAAHPFIDGNGRAQRVWLRVLADGAGYRLSLSGQDREAWNAASKAGFERSDHDPMTALLHANLHVRAHERDRDRGHER